MKNTIITSALALALFVAPLSAQEMGTQDKKVKNTETPKAVAHFQETAPKPDKKVEKAKKRAIRTDHTREFWNQKFKFVSF